jgi:hypothetical protein
LDGGGGGESLIGRIVAAFLSFWRLLVSALTGSNPKISQAETPQAALPTSAPKKASSSEVIDLLSPLCPFSLSSQAALPTPTLSLPKVHPLCPSFLLSQAASPTPTPIRPSSSKLLDPLLPPCPSFLSQAASSTPISRMPSSSEVIGLLSPSCSSLLSSQAASPIPTPAIQRYSSLYHHPAPPSYPRLHHLPLPQECPAAPR